MLIAGTAGDSLSYHRAMQFSTKDQDNDVYPQSCAQVYKGAWWYKNCHASNLNGFYHEGGDHKSYGDGINWKSWKGFYYSAMKSAMLIRPQ